MLGRRQRRGHGDRNRLNRNTEGRCPSAFGEFIVRFKSLFFALLLVGCQKPPAVEETPKPDAAKRVNASRPGSDWPRLLGPNGDGSSPEKGILTAWPKEGLKKLWDCKLGLGYAPPVVAAGKLYHFDRFGDNCRLTCRNAENGELIWKYESATEYEDMYGYEPGPRAGAIVDGETVYAIGPDGMLVAVNNEGKELWKVDTRKTYRFHQNFFGVGSVPLVVGDLLIVAVGGSPKGPRPFDLRDAKGDGSAIVAFDKKTGVEKYKLSDELASYSSPVLTESTGKQRFYQPWRAKVLESVNAANPVISGNTILVTECYGAGAIALEVNEDFTLKVLWSDKEADRGDQALMSHWSTPVLQGKYVYGCSGRHTPEGDIRCVELATGKVMWKESMKSRITFTKIDGHILAYTEEGSLLLFKPNPEKFEKVAEWKQIADMEYPSWAPPVVSRGLLYLRGKDKLACYELIPGK
jgi:outer membrane protein assembly factor BamB